MIRRLGDMASFSTPEPFVAAHVLQRHPAETSEQLAAKAREVLLEFAPDLLPMVLGEEAAS